MSCRGRRGRLRFRVRGPEGGMPVMGLHGFLGEGSDWLPVANAMPAEIQWILPDLPGHGESVELPAPGGYEFESAADALVEILDEWGLERAALAGYSMGGRVALYLALRRPDRFSKVMVVSGSPGIADPQERIARAARDDQIAIRLRSEPPKQFLREWYRQPIFASLVDRPDLVDPWIERRRHRPTDEWAMALQGMSTGRQPNLWPELARMSIPARFVAGGRDPKFTDLARTMSQNAPGSRLEVLAEAGHAPHAECPEAFAAVLARFLRGSPVS